MIFYPLESMAKAGVKEALLITGPDHSGSFINLLRSGDQFGLKMSYDIQEEAGGIAQGIALAEDFADNGQILVILGDNIFVDSLRSAVEDFQKRKKGAKVFAKVMPTECRQYGVIEIDEKKKVLSIEEKPVHPKSNLAQTGIYMYDNRVFDFIRKLKPSRRGEIEVTDLNNFYVKEGSLTCEVLKGWWIDAGTSFDELLRANVVVAQELKK